MRVAQNLVRLRRSARILRKLEGQADCRQPRSPSYREALDYRRSLYAEFGASDVRAELKEVSHE